MFAKFGVMRISKGLSEQEVEYMSNKKLVEASDYKGLTFRGAGYSTLVIQQPEFGGSGVILATADVYSSLQTGVIDACEVGNAFSNFASAYHEVTRYWGFPGVHQPTQSSSTIINMDVWNSLPADIQMIIRTCAAYNLLRSYTFNHLEAAKIIPRLQKEFGIEIVRQSPECQTAWKTVAWRLADAEAAKSPEFKKMWDNHKALMDVLAPYEELQTMTYAD